MENVLQKPSDRLLAEAAFKAQSGSDRVLRGRSAEQEVSL